MQRIFLGLAVAITAMAFSATTAEAADFYFGVRSGGYRAAPYYAGRYGHTYGRHLYPHTSRHHYRPHPYGARSSVYYRSTLPYRHYSARPGWHGYPHRAHGHGHYRGHPAHHGRVHRGYRY